MALRCALFGGRPHVASDLFEPHDPRQRSDEQLADIRLAFEGMVARLGRDQKQGARQVVITGALPSWFIRIKLRQALRPVDEHERLVLLEGPRPAGRTAAAIRKGGPRPGAPKALRLMRKPPGAAALQIASAWAGLPRVILRGTAI
jgi:hypothetical protein